MANPTIIICPECSAKLKVGQPLGRGKKMKCPKCAEVFAPEASDADEKQASATAVTRSPRKSAPKRRGDEEDDEIEVEDELDEDEDDRPSRKKDRGRGEKSRKGLWIGLGAGAVALVVVIVLIIVLVGGGSGGQGAANVAATADGLRDQFAALLESVKAKNQQKAEAQAREFILTNHREWFIKAFGAEDGKRAGDEYEQTVLAKKPEVGFVMEMEERLRRNQTQITAWKIDNPADNNATGIQKRILEKLKAPTSIYAVRFAAPGQNIGFRMDSFVFVDGKFRLIGRVRALGN